MSIIEIRRHLHAIIYSLKGISKNTNRQTFQDEFSLFEGIQLDVGGVKSKIAFLDYFTKSVKVTTLLTLFDGKLSMRFRSLPSGFLPKELLKSKIFLEDGDDTPLMREEE